MRIGSLFSGYGGLDLISRNDQLKALGNGVVPQQAALALRALLGQTVAA
jgi:DNA (cytosine-5)-methyltransferase 1